MDVAGLKLVLDAQVKEFDKALDALEKRADAIAGKLNNLSGSTGNLTSAANQVAPAVNTAADSITNLQDAADSGKTAFDGYDKLDEKFKNLEAAVSSMESQVQGSTGAMANATASANHLADAINKLDSSVKDLPSTTSAAGSGISDMQEKAEKGAEATDKYSESLKGVKEAGEEAKKGAKEAGDGVDKEKNAFEEADKSADDFVDGLIGSAGLTIATAIATDVFMKFAFSGLKVSEVLEGNIIAWTDAEKAQFGWNEQMAKSNASAMAELNTLDSLIGVIKDATSTRAQQTDAIKTINDKYPEYLSNLEAEKINTNAATVAISKQVELIMMRSKLQGAQAAYEKALAKQADAAVVVAQKQVQMQRELAENPNFFKGQVQMFRDVFNGIKLHGFSLDAGASIVEVAQKDLDEANAVVDVFKKNLDEVFKDASEAGMLEKILGTDDSGKTVKKVRTVKDVLVELDKEMKAIQERSSIVGMSIDNLAGERLQALNKAFDEIAKIGGPNARKELEKIAQEINTVSASILGVQKIDTKQIFTFSKQKIKDNEVIGGKAQEVIALNLPVRVTFTELETGIAEAQQRLQAGIKQTSDYTYDAWAADLEDLNKKLNILAKEVLINGAIAIAEGVGGALAGSGDFIGAFLNVIASGLEQLGKLLITFGASILAFKISLQDLNPYVAIAAGAAAFAAAGAVRTFAKKGVKSYATGGVTDGPTLAMVGDNPSGREAMIPEELWPYLGGGNSPIHIENRIDAQGLLTIVKRGQREEGRVR